jgi:drug/metabolite transporter (DMT)-like permease
MFNADIGSAALGAVCAALWGAGDFCGGLAAKRTGVYAVVVGSQLCGVAALVVLAIASHETIPPPVNLAGCGAAGVCGAVGLLALYRALAVGRMGMAAPISGVLSAAVPVVAGAMLQGVPGSLTVAGFALALAGVWLVSYTEAGVFQPGALGLPVVAGLGFGLFIVIIGRTSGGGVYWPLVAARITSLSVLSVVATASRQPRLPGARALPMVAMAGLFDAAGNAFLVLATQAGRLDVAGVVSSLYPVSTVVLAVLILKERVSRWQFAGLLAAFSAIVLITLP